MKKEDYFELTMRARSAYSRLTSLSADVTQSPLVNKLVVDARNDVSAILLELERDLKKRMK